MDDAKRSFLQALQDRIDRYQPMLEQEFDVSLGPVVAKPLLTREWLAWMYAKSDEQLHRETISAKGHPPTALRLLIHRLEKAVLFVPAWAFLTVRTWYPEYFVKWRDETKEILVSFTGWSNRDYAETLKKVDQLAVHELAHGIWSLLAGDQDEDHDRRWRLWNEGFAHYVADVFMADRYPQDAVIADEFSSVRKRGLRLVSAVVRSHGPAILRSLPRRWREFDANHSDLVAP